MDIARVKHVFEKGPGNSSSWEHGVSVVFANHVASFRQAFVSQLEDFRVVIWDRQSNAKLELCGAPHRVLLEQMTLAGKPDYVALIKLQQRNVLRRLHKGAHSVCLQPSGKGSGHAELWIERKDTSAPEPALDGEDRANFEQSSEQHARMFREEKCIGQRRY